jgi:hypothetical protein
MKGDMIDRYGYETGTFVAPALTPYFARALPPGSDAKPLMTYEVMKPFEVNSGRAAAAFGQIGNGVQHELPMSVGKLVQKGFLKRVGQ